MNGGMRGKLAVWLVFGVVVGGLAHAQSGGKPCYFGQCEEKPRCFFGEDCDQKGQPTAPPATPAPRPAPTLISGRYQDNGDGTVTDMQTNLQWMRCALGQSWQSGTCTGEAAGYQWQAALNVAKAVNSRGGYASYQDWRVPSREELRSLVYCSSGRYEVWHKDTGARECKGEYSKPTIDTTAFPNTPASGFWSASPNASSAGSAWSVYFNYGNDYWSLRSYALHVRLVRAGQ